MNISTFYFTFGVGQEHPLGYCAVDAENEHIAREIMAKKYGAKWAFCYTESAFKDQPEKYNLHQVDILSASGHPLLDRLMAHGLYLHNGVYETYDHKILGLLGEEEAVETFLRRHPDKAEW